MYNPSLAKKFGVALFAGLVFTTFSPDAKAGVYSFKSNPYSYTSSGITYNGTITGSFDYTGGANVAGTFSNVSVTFSSADYIASNANGGTQQSFTYTGGAAQATSGSTQLLYFWDPASTSGGGSKSTRGVTVNMVSGGLGTGNIAFNTATTNDQFCNSINISGSNLGNCTSQKNNFTVAPTGSVSVPAPSVLLGLLPFLLLSLKKWQILTA
jgi:hypothetical protein